MKLRQQVEDFVVEELPTISPSVHGEFAFYRLEKRGWTTPDALAAICRRWQIERRRLSYGGLKDRHAATVQYLTIHRGPARGLEHSRIKLSYLGQLEFPYQAEHFRGNAFALVLRGLKDADLDRASAALADTATAGVANYFDDQRFGSTGDGQSFIAREMVLGRFEEALRLALAGRYEHERSQAKKERGILIEHWGQWVKCKAELPRGHARSIVDYLVHHPTDFRGACARLRPELQGLYLSAWQSHLWNQMLAHWLRTHLPADQLVPIRLKTAEVVMPRAVPVELQDEWERLVLPLPSARLKFDPGAPWAEVVTAVMSEAGVPLDQMRIRGLQRPFFSKGERLARIPVANVAAAPGADELNPGRRKLELRFELPRGCYATMVVKRLTALR